MLLHYLQCSILLGNCQLEGLDVVFGVDMSSRSSKHFKSIKTFMSDFSKSLSTHTKHLKLGSLKYGSEAVVTFPFKANAIESSSLFFGMIEKLSVVDNGRSLDAALVTAYEMFFKPQHNRLASAHLTVDRIKELITGGREKVIQDDRDQQNISRKKLFVLLVAGDHINSGLDVLPKHAARLLYDLGVQIVVVAFNNNEISGDVKSITRNPVTDIFRTKEGSLPIPLLKSLCKRFGTRKYIVLCF